MKSLASIATIAVIAAVLCGCGEPKEKVQALQSDLDKSKAQVASLTAELATAKSQLEAAQQQITALTPLAQKARTLPLVITTRKAALGNGFVLQLKNTSPNPLPVIVKAHSKTFGDKSKNFILSPGLTEEIGHVELMDFLSGDTAEISSDGFDGQTKTF